MKVSSGVRGLSLGGDLSCLHIQRGEERGGAMPDVIMGLSGGLPRLQGQAGLGGRQGLNLGFFIHGQHQGMRWRLHIQANRLPRRAGEVGVRRDLELATTVRARPCCRQMRCTVVGFRPTSCAMRRQVQCDTPAGSGSRVRVNTSCTFTSQVGACPAAAYDRAATRPPLPPDTDPATATL